MPSENTKRIARNTLYLYLRMLVVMGVNLFTVRIVLQALGAEDYGINNVVGGVVAMFSFLTSTMTSASQRFFSFSLGQRDDEKLSRYFSMSFWCYIGLIVITIILAETLGLWFVVEKLTIPDSRMTAAIWVYHLSIFSFAISILQVPYNSIIIAREKMNIYAYIGLIEVFLKLIIAYLLFISPFDKLIVYATLLLIMNFVISLFYVLYGVIKYEECRVRRFWDKKLFNEVLSYSGWSLFGALSGVVRSQGINILLNVFFNPIVNAARAIAYQVNSALTQFVVNFFKAVQPQIIKYYANSETGNFENLIARSSRYCFYMIFALSLPIIVETPFILGLWLKDVPNYTILFTRLTVVIVIIDSLGYPLQTAVSATGRIKWYQIVTGGLLILSLPVAWLFLHLGYSPMSTMYVCVGMSIVSQLSRIYFSKSLFDMSIIRYVSKVLLPILIVLVTSFFLIFLVSLFTKDCIVWHLVMMLMCILIVLLTSFVFGIPKSERQQLLKFAMVRIRNEK